MRQLKSLVVVMEVGAMQWILLNCHDAVHMRVLSHTRTIWQETEAVMGAAGASWRGMLCHLELIVSFGLSRPDAGATLNFFDKRPLSNKQPRTSQTTLRNPLGIAGIHDAAYQTQRI